MPSGVELFEVYVFTDLSANPTTSGGKIFEFYVFTGILFSVQPPAAISFLYYVFTSRVLHNTPSGGSIFRCTTKDRGERRAKGVATPFNPLGLMRDSILTYFVPTSSQRCV